MGALELVGDSIGGMPVDAKLQAILDAGKALGRKPVELQTPAEARDERAEMVAQFVPMPEYAGVRVEDRTIFVADGAGVREIAVRVYRPGDGPRPVVVFFHGGGFVVCTLETHDPYCRALATEAGVMVVSVDYRLAPEHKFPAGLEDWLAATDWVLAPGRGLGARGSWVVVVAGRAGGAVGAGWD